MQTVTVPPLKKKFYFPNPLMQKKDTCTFPERPPNKQENESSGGSHEIFIVTRGTYLLQEDTESFPAVAAAAPSHGSAEMHLKPLLWV